MGGDRRTNSVVSLKQFTSAYVLARETGQECGYKATLEHVRSSAAWILRCAYIQSRVVTLL